MGRVEKGRREEKGVKGEKRRKKEDVGSVRGRVERSQVVGAMRDLPE
jgi:hypothetical protein